MSGVPPSSDSCRMSAGSPGMIWPMRARCGCVGEQRLRAARRANHKAACAPSTSDSARRIAQSSRASPGGKLARLADLHAAFGVDVDAGFFRIGRAGQDHVGAVCAIVAMGADVDRRRRRARRRSRRRRAETPSRARPAAPWRRRQAHPRPAQSRSRARRPARPRCAARNSRSSPPSPRQARWRPWRRARRPRRRPAAPARRSPTMTSGRSHACSVAAKPSLPATRSASVSGPAPR